MSLKSLLLIMLTASLVLIQSITTNAQFTLQKINDRKLYKPTSKGFGMPLKKVEYPNPVNLGILSCQTGKMGILTSCVVRNMPLLNQTDPRLDADIKDMGLSGCYDTSIATVILTALANRTNTQPLKGRTKEFAEVPADGSIPKEVEQLSWFYRTAKKAAKGEKDKNGNPIQSLYLSEVLADFGNINESCNPYIFADCKNTTNQYGHAYYEFTDKGQNWTNDFIIKKMREGYTLFIAYARYNPFISQDENGKKIVKFSPAGVHKVVFSGFQIGNKYPLLINDVGTGMQNRVRLTTDLSERKFAKKDSTTAESYSEIIYPQEVKTRTFMEYEGEAVGINNEVDFIVHMDALKLK
jgi:hypothetical protein